MRRVTGSIALAALALLGGCAHPAPPQAAVSVPHPGRPVVQRQGVVSCSTTYLVVATVAQCGADGMKIGIAGE